MTALLEERDDNLLSLARSVDPVHDSVSKAMNAWNDESKNWIHGKCALRADSITSMYEVGNGYSIVYSDRDVYRVRSTIDDILEAMCMVM